jgi:AraC-like DNA-binding protein
MERIAPDSIAHQVRFAAASPELLPYLGGYHSFDTHVPTALLHEEMVLPAWINVQVQTSGGEWGIRIGARNFDPLPRLMVTGPTSKAQFCRVITGHIIGVYLMPRGWARLVGGDASEIADRIVDMHTILGPDADKLSEAVLAARDFAGQVAAFETVFRRRLAASAPEPPEVAQIEALLLDPDMRSVDDVVSALGIPARRFAALVRRHFGFTPKLLIRRTRFVRTIVKIRDAKSLGWARIVDEAYVDQSHFIRDCRDFLGMTPRQFTARYQPVTHASMEERTRVLGDPHHVLQEG